MMKNNKWMAMVLCAAMVCAVLAGCMNAGARVTPDAAPSGRPEESVMPGIDFGQSMTSDTDADRTGLPAPFDWLGMGQSVQDKINMLSEIQESRIVVNGNTALVGVTFAGQYKGEMTQRIRDMIAGEVQKADANIQTVAVTAEQEDVQKINEIADKIAAGTPVGELEGEIDSIVRNMTTMQ